MEIAAAIDKWKGIKQHHGEGIAGKATSKGCLRNCRNCKDLLETNAKELGLSLYEADEAVVLLYDDVFAAVVKEEYAVDLEKDKLVKLIKDVLEKFAQQLESSPVYQDFDC